MYPFLASVHTALALVGVAGVSSSPGVAIGALLITAVFLVALLSALSAPPAARTAAEGPLRSTDIAVAPAQSDPDAAGHPRSRAPGLAAPAA